MQIAESALGIARFTERSEELDKLYERWEELESLRS